MRRASYFFRFVLALLFFSLPFIAQAQYFGLSPAEVRIDGLAPGSKPEFELTIRNEHDKAYTFILGTYQPWEEERREGRAEFPDDRWIDFFPNDIQVAAKSEDTVKVTVAIPSNEKWAEKDWEIWLSASPESGELLTVKLYVRLLISTSGGAPQSPHTGFVVGIIAALVLIAWGVRRLRHSREGK